MGSEYAIHQSEWVYSSPISRQLAPLNEYIHHFPSVPHPAELFVAACGYAFNPVMFPFWPTLIYGLTYRGMTNATRTTSPNESECWGELASMKPTHAALLNTMVYLASVLLTLAFTEMGKASFATTRPRVPSGGYDNLHEWTRRYGKLVASLKSKHSFPSGDSAQAMNLCMFLCRYVPLQISTIPLGGVDIPALNLLLFGIFLPGVAFARVFYRCHWIEDCIGGILLSWTLHRALMPALSTMISIELAPWLAKVKICERQRPYNEWSFVADKMK